MLLLENITLAISSLLSNKMRALLTMLGIIIGIGSVIAIITVGDSLTLSVSENMQSMGANDIYITVKEKNQEEEKSSVDGIKYGTISNSSEITEDDYLTEDMIKEMCDRYSDKIYAINIQYSVGTGNVDRNKNSSNVNIYGVTPGYFITNDINLLGGHMFSQNDFNEGKNTTIVSDKLVNNLFDGDIKKAIGSEIEVATNGQISRFTIIGVYEYQDNYMMGMAMSGNNVTTNLFIPLKAVSSFEHRNTTYPYVQIITKVGVNSDELVTRLKDFFAPYYRTNRNVEVTAFTMGSMVSMLTEMLSTITLAISIVAGIALIVGGIGVMNIMLVSVTERTREIGTRKALGAKNSSIRTQFIVEAMIICLIGGMIGVILGIVGGIIASNLLGYPASPSISGIIISLVFSMSIGVFFGYYPANKAAKMNPIDALRYE